LDLIPNGNLDTGSLTSLVATGSNVLAGNYLGLAAAYSLRRVTSSYSGFAIEVQSGSVSQSIGFDSFGNLDTASLLTFVGSGNGFVKTWYDQSGNNRHATQSVTTNQPQIVSNGSVLLEGSKPSLQFDGINDRLEFAEINLTQSTALITLKRNATSTAQDLLDVQNPIQSYSSLNVTINEIASYGRLLTFAGGSTIGAISGFVNPLTDYRLYSTVWDGLGINGASFYKIYDNGSLQSLTNSGALGSSNGATSLIGAANGASGATRFFDGKIQEIILYEIDQSANIVALNNNINAYYNIYTTSSTSTENAFISTWYDQSGNNRHATQTATGSQPLIVSSGSLVTENGKPAVRFDGSTNYLETSTFGPISQPYTTFTHVEYASMPEYPYLVDHGSETGIVGAYNAGGGHRIYAGGNLYFGSSAVINTPYLYYGLFSGSNSAISINGATAVSGSPGGSGISKITLGAAGTQAPSTFFSGSFFEHLEYHSDQSANKALIENNINNYYNIYTGSNHGFVARWYDQSGNNRHATQTATGSQPIIVESGSVVLENGKPALGFDVNKQQRIFSTTLVPHQQIVTVMRNTYSSNSYFLDYRNRGASDGWIGWSNSMGGFWQPGSFKNGVTSTSTLGYALYNFIGDYQVNAEVLYNTGYPNGTMSEVIAFATALTTQKEPIEYGINNYYNIYPQTSSFATSSFTIQATPTAISGAINNKLTSGIPSSGPLGLITVSRTGSNSLTIARNGVTSSFAVPASGALSTGIYLGAINNNGLALGNSPLGI
jgi:hypothetical protein